MIGTGDHHPETIGGAAGTSACLHATCLHRLLGEQAILPLAAVPAGLLLGYGFVSVTTWGYDTELFHVPAVFFPRTYAVAAATVITTIMPPAPALLDPGVEAEAVARVETAKALYGLATRAHPAYA